MSQELQAQTNQTTGTVYARLWNATGQYWYTVTPAFEAFNAAHITSYNLAATQDSTTGKWTASMPAAGVGTYSYAFYLQAGGSPAVGDTPISTVGSIDWTGTVASAAIAYLPQAQAGAANGVLISGTNAGTTTLGALTVSGATTLAAISCTTLTASGAVAFQSTFAVTSTTTLTGAVSFGSTFAVTGTTTLAAVNTGAIGTGNVTITGTLSTSGTTTLNALTVTNATTLSGDVSLGSTLGVTGTTTLSGAVSLGSTLSVTGTTTLAAINTGAIGTGNVTVTGTLSTSSTVTLNALTVTNAFTVSGATTLTGVVSATNAGNDIEGVHVTAGTITSITGNVGGDVVGKVLGGGASAFTAVGVQADVQTIKTNPVVNAGTVTFPTGATLASTTNITAGTVTTVSGNVGGRVVDVSNIVSGGAILVSSGLALTDVIQLNGVQVATTGSGSVTFVAGGTVSTFNSATDSVTVGTNNDKTGYALSNAGLAEFFTVDTGQTFAGAVPGSVVAEIGDNASDPTAIAAAVFATTGDGGYTFSQWLELVGAAATGKSSGGPFSPIYLGMGVATVRISATCDSDGNRTAVTLTP